MGPGFLLWDENFAGCCLHNYATMLVPYIHCSESTLNVSIESDYLCLMVLKKDLQVQVMLNLLDSLPFIELNLSP